VRAVLRADGDFPREVRGDQRQDRLREREQKLADLLRGQQQHDAEKGRPTKANAVWNLSGFQSAAEALAREEAQEAAEVWLTKNWREGPTNRQEMQPVEKQF